jgi:hypothetical protein
MNKLLILITLSLLIAGCGDASFIQPGLVSAEDTFMALIADPIPDGVEVIDGGALTYQGYTAYLVFSIDQAYLDQLKNRNLASRKLTKDRLKFGFTIREDIAERLPASLKENWQPKSVTNGVIYENTPHYKNGWSHDATETYLIDLDKMMVYYVSGGS